MSTKIRQLLLILNKKKSIRISDRKGMIYRKSIRKKYY